MSNDHFKFGSTLLVEQELIDFSTIDRKGRIELIAIQKTAHKHNPEASFRCFLNTKTGKWHGIPIGKNPDGTFKFKPIRITAGKSYTLENKQDAEEWAVVKDYYRIKGGDMERDPLFMVDNVEERADTGNKEFSNIVKAGSYVSDLSGNKLIEFGRLFGIDPYNNSPTVIKNQLLEIAKMTPKKILEKMEGNSDTEIAIVIKRGLSVGIIKQSIDRGIVYKDGIALGATEKGAIEFLRKDLPLLANIDSESKGMDKFYVSTNQKEEQPGPTFSATSSTATIENFDNIPKEEAVDKPKKKGNPNWGKKK